MPLKVVLVMKTLEDGWYVVINTYKFAVFEIWRYFALSLSYNIIVSALSLHIESTDSTDSMVTTNNQQFKCFHFLSMGLILPSDWLSPNLM